MLWPYENYLTAALLRGLNNDIIMGKLKAYGLSPLSEEELNSRREELFKQLPKKYASYIYPEIKPNLTGALAQMKDSLGFLEVDEVIDVLLGKRDPDWEEILAVMLSDKARLAVMTLTLAEKPDLEVLTSVNETYGYKLTSRALAMFKKYFWNVDKMSRLEQYDYITSVTVFKWKQRLMDAFHKKEEAVKWYGLGQSTLTLEAILKEIMNEAFFKFREHIHNPSLEATADILKWAEAAVKMAEKYHRLTGSQGKDLITQLKFELERGKQVDIQSTQNFKGEIV